MKELSRAEMEATGGANWTWCGIALGMTIGATMMYGGVGFALTANKALASCAVAALR